MFALKRAFSQSLRQIQPLVRCKHTLPELPYAYDALEPIISRDIMVLHHQKHHQAYVTNLNIAEEKIKAALECGDVSAAIALEPGMRFNGGGHLNHSIFWQNLSPTCCEPSQRLMQLVQKSFGSVDNMKAMLTASAMGVQGSGWAWLGYDKKTQTLKVVACANQDPLEATTGLIPFFGIDVWEHAYYLQYKNVRADYVKGIFDIINWKYMNDTYDKILGC